VEDEFQRYARQLEDFPLDRIEEHSAAYDQPSAFLVHLDTRDVLRLSLDRVPDDTVVALDVSELTGCSCYRLSLVMDRRSTATLICDGAARSCFHTLASLSRSVIGPAGQAAGPSSLPAEYLRYYKFASSASGERILPILGLGTVSLLVLEIGNDGPFNSLRSTGAWWRTYSDRSRGGFFLRRLGGVERYPCPSSH